MQIIELNGRFAVYEMYKTDYISVNDCPGLRVLWWEQFGSGLSRLGKKRKEEPTRVALAGSKRGGRGLCWEREEGKSYVTKSVARMF